MQDFSQTQLLVVGDVMLDQYWMGRANRISPEAPVPVVKVNETEGRAGGAANVALNIAALGAQVTLMGVVGQDEAADVLTDVLAAQQVTCHWVRSDAGTIRKLRVLSHHQQLIRMDFEQPLESGIAEALANAVENQVANYDALVISDYAKGSLGQVERMIAAAKRQGVPVLVDPKGLDFTPYHGATLIKPNQSEFEQIVGQATDTDDLIAKATQLVQDLALQALLITRSENGMALIEQDKEPFLDTSKAQEVFDVTGAGDTVLATLSVAMASGMALPKAVHLANEAAGIVVRKVGTSVVTKVELDEQIKQSQRHQGYIAPDETEVTNLIRLAQAQGERVVFTNGCFDLLHSGHVRYLNEAAKLGDRLIVAVNSDESVQQLKGPSRPIVPLESRMELLSALSCVDWVVPFAEETPERLICHLKPNVLVKGGDYQPEQIAGAQCVWQNGGTVEVLSFWQGYSTTSMVQKIEQVQD